MNKTGARILGGFFAALIAWLWGGWGEPATGVPLGSTMATTLAGACIVITEWVLVKEPVGRAARGRLSARRKGGAQSV